MDKVRAAVTAVTERVARSRPVIALRTWIDSGQETSASQRGQGLAEYALILSGIAIVAIVSLAFLGNSVSLLFEDIINEGFRYVQTIINS